MVTNPRSNPRREESLTRDRIVEAAIELLDGDGEGSLTFRTLSQRLATGPGAIYGHVANKSDLLTAACDTIVARAAAAGAAGKTPRANLRAFALAMFDAMDAHAWVGSALIQAAGQMPTVRILERIGRQVRALGVPDDAQWAAASALLHYILGVGGLNAANTQFARARGADRSNFLDTMAAAWSRLDPAEYPFARSVAGQLRAHDDRVDFLAGIDLILRGLKPSRER